MSHHSSDSPHTFHIPVMGTGFTIDTPVHVAPYGISSVISMVDDVLIESMRKYHSERRGISYEPILDSADDPRADRITAYLNLINRIVDEQVAELRRTPFGPGSKSSRYFEQLPPSKLRTDYEAVLCESESDARSAAENALRQQITAGSIDVNIMTKLDVEHYRDGVKRPQEYSDAMAALRGYANSDLSSSVVCSAGMNRTLYKYMTTFDDFFPDPTGEFKKKITLKVTNFRSAEVQAMFFARMGLWVSEFRIESGLNCGGHAFASKGELMGPILEAFKDTEQLRERLMPVYEKALVKRDAALPDTIPEIQVTAQGGIGTHQEHRLLCEYYRMDRTGWGTPFLLVPEAVNCDEAHLAKLLNAGPDDVYLSDSSPLGIKFWNLRTSASEAKRQQRIDEHRPGSPCRKRYLAFDTTYTDVPVCRASSAYQSRHLAEIETMDITPEERDAERERTLVKSCICHDLAGSATIPLGIDPSAHTAVCCGPNIFNFRTLASLKEMIDHIYGRTSLLMNSERPHMLVKELTLNLSYFKDEVKAALKNPRETNYTYLVEFKENLLSGIDYYLSRAEQLFTEGRDRMIHDIQQARAELEQIMLVPAV